MKKIAVVIVALLLAAACNKEGRTPADPNPPGNPGPVPGSDSFWTGRVYGVTIYPPMYPGLKRTLELEFLSGSAFTQRFTDYVDGDTFESIHYHTFGFDSATNYLVITSGNNPPTLSSNLLQYVPLGDSILSIGRSGTDTIIQDNAFLRIR